MSTAQRAEIIDGKAVAGSIREGLKKEVEALQEERGITPGLSVILVGEDPASKVYVRNKHRACEAVGIKSFQHLLSAETSEAELLSLISKLNSRKDVHGILVQLPLPSHIKEDKVIEAISPAKDVDGFHPYNMGRLLAGRPRFEPCTPLGIMELIDSIGFDCTGREAVIVGRSNIVGKPVALMILKRNATVTICHSKTGDLEAEVGRADLLVAATGVPRMIKGSWIKEGAVVVDVGITRTPEGRLVGDVEFEEASKRASFITPVPGGVGPMTIAMLLKNTVKAARLLQAG